MGQVERTIARQAVRMGKPLPDRIQNAPELNLGLSLYLSAFFDLDTERHHGFGLMQIPWSKIQQYAEVNFFDDEQTANLHHHIRAMDRENLKRLDKKR